MRCAAALLVLCAACSGAGDDGTTPDVLIAVSSTFSNFRAWPSFHSDGPPAGSVPDAVLGARTQYVNKLPPPGSTEFPTGTIIVEARETGEMKIFAAVKRGGNYNASGALNWEWFELLENPVTIFWRGVGPPAGDMYGGDPNGGCNSCHTTCGAANDFVCSSKLQLGSF